MAVLKWVGLGLLGLVVLVVAAAGIALAVLDWNDARGYLARQATQALGREVAIDGPLDVELGDPIRIHVEGIRVANTDWAEERTMAELRVLDAQLRPWPLLRGDWEFPEIRLTGPKLALEKNREGANNWTFGADPRKEAAKESAMPEDRGDIPIIEHLVIDGGRVRYRDPVAEVDVNSTINTATGGSGDERVRLDGKGGFAGKPFTLTVEGGSLLYLRDDPKPYPVRIETAVGKTQGRIEGSIGEPVKLQGVDLSVELKGPDLAEIFPILGIPTPRTRAYALSGHLTREGQVWRFEGMKGKVGESDLAGVLAVDLGGERPRITGDLTSNRLAAEDMAGFVGASPKGTGDYPTKGPGRVIPATEVSFERLTFADMDVRFKGKRIEAPFAPLDGLDAHLRLENGRLTLDPVKLGVGGGRVSGTTVLNARAKPPALDTDLEIRQVQLARFFRGTAFAREMGGTLTGRINLAGRGGTVADILGNADGKLGLAIDGGRVTSLAEAGLKTNILETLGIALSGDEPVRFNCFVVDTAVENGVARVGALVFDTDETLVTGRGSIDLRDERMDLRVVGDSKSPQIFATHVPVLVGGTFKNPDIGVDASETAARGAAAVALGVLLTPLAAILPLMDPGTDEDAACGQLIRDARSPARNAPAAGGSGDTSPPSGPPPSGKGSGR